MKRPLTRTKRNLSSLLLCQIVTWVVEVTTLVIVPRTLGPATYGELAFATAFLGFFGLISFLGSNTFLVKTIARDPTQVRAYMFNALVMKFVLGTLVAAAAVGTAIMLGYPLQTVLIVETGCIGMVLATMTDILAAALQGTERMGRLALWAAAQQCISAPIAIGLLLGHHGVVVYSFVIALGAAIPLVANGQQLWPEIRGRIALDLQIWKTIATGGLPFLLWNGILLVYGSVDILMLQQMSGSKTVGWYMLAYSWVGIPVFFASILSTVLLPSLSVRASRSLSDLSATINKALRLVIFAGTPMAIGIALVAGNIVSLFHYPSSFDHTVPLMQILAAHIPIVGVDMLLAVAINATDRQKAWLVVGCIAGVFNPLVNFIAIPLTGRLFADGAVGAASVTVATEVVMMIGAIYLRPRGVLDRATISFMLRTGLAGLLIIPPVLVAASAPLVIKVAIGMATFCLASFTLRLISVRDVREGGSQILKAIKPGGSSPATYTALEQT
jgi:O-antigen/teichoic acid export membrane protein